MKIQFVHIPKCAGVAIYQGLKKSFGLTGEYIPIGEIFQAIGKLHYESRGQEAYEIEVFRFLQGYAALQMQRSFPIIGSHLPFSLRLFEQFSHEYRFLTILREPEERFYSHISYNAYAEGELFKKRNPGAAFDPLAFVHQLLKNETRLETLGNQYAKFLGLCNFNGAVESEGRLQRAITALGCFSVIGFTDNLDAFANEVERQFGKRPVFERANEAKLLFGDPKIIEELKAAFTPDVRKRLKKFWAEDKIIYEAAKNLVSAKTSDWLEAYAKTPSDKRFVSELTRRTSNFCFHSVMGWVQLAPSVDARLRIYSPSIDCWLRLDDEKFLFYSWKHEEWFTLEKGESGHAFLWNAEKKLSLGPFRQLDQVHCQPPK